MRKDDEVLDQSTGCKEIVNQYLEVQAQVTITPLVRHGHPKVYCMDSEIREDCHRDCTSQWDCMSNRRCHKNSFILRQVICVEIPISLGVDVDVEDGISCYSRPELGPCEHQHKHSKDID